MVTGNIDSTDSRDGGAQGTKRDFLPPDKQFLITRKGSLSENSC
jgi:hypothetical protein